MVTDYYQIFEKQLNGDYNIIMEEYQNYRTIMFDKNAQCPINKKEKLEKEFTDKGFKLFCNKSKKEYLVEVEKPVLKNINEEYEKINYDLSILVNKFKDNILRLNTDLVSNIDIEKDTEELLKELGKIESTKESIEKIFQYYKVKDEELVLKKKNILSQMLETKKKQDNIYVNCEPLMTDKVKELGEIYKTEGIPIVTRQMQLEKKYEIKNIKNWFLWFDEVKKYLELLNEKKKLEKDMKDLSMNKQDIIEKLILVPPKIISKKE